MYKNSIPRRATNLDLQSLIRRSEIPFDKRARFVEFVCDVWNEGRFGPNRAAPVIIDWKDRPDLEPASFLDLDDGGQNGPNCLPSAISPYPALRTPLGRAGYQKIGTSFQRAMQTGLMEAEPAVLNSPTALSPNQGRGSP
jgi:hypothetical protein